MLLLSVQIGRALIDTAESNAELLALARRQAGEKTGAANDIPSRSRAPNTAPRSSDKATAPPPPKYIPREFRILNWAAGEFGYRGKNIAWRDGSFVFRGKSWSDPDQLKAHIDALLDGDGK